MTLKVTFVLVLAGFYYSTLAIPMSTFVGFPPPPLPNVTACSLFANPPSCAPTEGCCTLNDATTLGLCCPKGLRAYAQITLPGSSLYTRASLFTRLPLIDTYLCPCRHSFRRSSMGTSIPASCGMPICMHMPVHWACTWAWYASLYACRQPRIHGVNVVNSHTYSAIILPFRVLPTADTVGIAACGTVPVLFSSISTRVFQRSVGHADVRVRVYVLARTHANAASERKCDL